MHQPLVADDVEHGETRPPETGLPPKVLKYSMPLAKAAAISGRQATAPIGWPLPIGLPMVTMSGTDVLGLEGPEMRADAAEADLHFVGDADAAGAHGSPRRPLAR